ncbi:unnamed protein product [Trifolium pratense]|uniref:Uncharacterized protein n=1 Tax=Trifolium pratense TaxID=57577 RepID=A0ACB0LAV6_TRIPR|nr:unnamed protein product [Trifolium pratense]
MLKRKHDDRSVNASIEDIVKASEKRFGWDETDSTWEPRENLICAADLVEDFEKRKGSEKHQMLKRKHDDRSVNASEENIVKAPEKRAVAFRDCIMVSAREMEARLETLERGFEGLLTMRENVEKILEEDRRERLEACQQVAELTALMCRNLHMQGETHGDGDQTDSDDTSVHHDHNRPSEERWRKLKIPVFEGTDAYEWLSKVDRYFELKKFNDREKLQAVMVAMEGKALAWYQWWEFSAQNPSWEEFRTAVLKRFQPSMIQSPFELLLSLTQTERIEEYREQFELYAGPLKCTEPAYLKGIFLNGPKDVIRAELKLHPVEKLTELMDYAQRVDEKNMLLTKGSIETGSIGRSTRTFNNSKTITFEPEKKVQTTQFVVGSCVGEGNSSKSSEAVKGQIFKKLTDAELQDRRVKGLCFRCDEKFGPGHRCPSKQLQVLIMAEDDYKERRPKMRWLNSSFGILVDTYVIPHLEDKVILLGREYC